MPDDHQVAAVTKETPRRPKVTLKMPMLINDYFDEFAYISQGRLKEGEDPYSRYAFNQQASERFRSDRNVFDTRHYM